MLSIATRGALVAMMSRQGLYLESVRMQNDLADDRHTSGCRCSRESLGDECFGSCTAATLPWVLLKGFPP